MTSSPPKLLFFVTEDWYFCSHRLPLALAAQRAGFEVVVATRVRTEGERIRQAGLRLIPLELSRRGTNPLAELALLLRLIALYRREKPDLIHQVAIKPVLYGSLAARLAGIPRVVNAIAGLGWLFTSDSGKARWLSQAVAQAFRLLLNRGKLIVQNPNDREFLVRLDISPERIALIQGSGVNVDEFAPSPEAEGPPLVVLPARMLSDKGVGEFVEAARRLKSEGVSARFALVGAPDTENPAAIKAEQLAAWAAEGVVECWGHRADMAKVLRQAHIVCLPSYREGLPKALIEAAAAGRPIVTTDVPGCRDVVNDGENGLLAPARTVEPLAKALQGLIEDADLRRRMGAKGREIALERFSQERIIADTLAIYRELLTGVIP